jgi:tyrosinase
MFERRDVWKLGSEADPWDPIIRWYARAITALKGRAQKDPTSWRYLASIHGTFMQRSDWPQGVTWNECQHSSWFFLPWHRIYLHYFERIVRRTIVDLGGPDDWALPYWDYSDPQRPNARSLPRAFREPQMPSGDPNPLFVSERSQQNPDINNGGRLDALDVEIGDAIAETSFTGPSDDGIAGFGGPITDWNHSGGPVGSLERTPHGNVHIGVGGFQPLGLMSRFETAALDPIFWLHHSNIDRLWEAWLVQVDPDRQNPRRARWRDASFTVGQGGPAVTLTVREVLDSTQPPLNYTYSDVSVPALAPGAVLAARSDVESVFTEEGPVSEDEELVPEMVGASENRVPLAAEPTEVEVAVETPSGPALREGAEGAQPRKVYLKVENVRGKELVAPAYLVYVNLPPRAEPADYEDRRAGQVPMFGVLEASESDEEHSGSGLTFSFDITGVVQRLREAGDWDPQRLRVTFTPARVGAERGGDVSAGRVSLYYA